MLSMNLTYSSTAWAMLVAYVRRSTAQPICVNHVHVALVLTLTKHSYHRTSHTHPRTTTRPPGTGIGCTGIGIGPVLSFRLGFFCLCPHLYPVALSSCLSRLPWLSMQASRQRSISLYPRIVVDTSPSLSFFLSLFLPLSFSSSSAVSGESAVWVWVDERDEFGEVARWTSTYGVCDM